MIKEPRRSRALDGRHDRAAAEGGAWPRNALRVIAIGGSAGAIAAGLAAAAFERRAKESREHVETLREALREAEGRRADE